MELKDKIVVIAAALGGTLAQALGGWDAALQAGFRGLVRKCAMLVLVLLGALLDSVTGNSCIRDGICLFLIANEGLSILENLGLMGVPYPSFLQNILEALKDKNSQRKEGK